jgi:hypothetical protein
MAAAAGYFDDDSMLRRIHRERAVALSGPRELDANRLRMFEGDGLHVTDWARGRARQIVLEPPVPWVARPLLESRCCRRSCDTCRARAA